MTAEIINLRQARKARARSAKDAQAAENRAKSGISKADRERQGMETDRAVRQLDGARITEADLPSSATRNDDPPSGGAA